MHYTKLTAGDVFEFVGKSAERRHYNGRHFLLAVMPHPHLFMEANGEPASILWTALSPAPVGVPVGQLYSFSPKDRVRVSAGLMAKADFRVKAPGIKVAPKAVARAKADGVRFEVSLADRALIEQIAKRAVNMGVYRGRGARLDAMMDLTAVHANGQPLDLRKLLAADGFNLTHDTAGIRRHLDRTTGKLGGHFLPRCALKE